MKSIFAFFISFFALVISFQFFLFFIAMSVASCGCSSWFEKHIFIVVLNLWRNSFKPIYQQHLYDQIMKQQLWIWISFGEAIFRMRKNRKKTILRSRNDDKQESTTFLWLWIVAIRISFNIVYSIFFLIEAKCRSISISFFRWKI